MSTEYVTTERYKEYDRSSREITQVTDFEIRVNAQKQKLLNELRTGFENTKRMIENHQRLIDNIWPKADFYLTIQRKIIPTKGYPAPDPEVVEAWQNFIMMVKLTLDNPVSGLTKA